MTHAPTPTGPFYHGTRADLAPGDLLAPGLCFAQLRFRLQLRDAQAVLDHLLRPVDASRQLRFRQAQGERSSTRRSGCELAKARGGNESLAPGRWYVITPV